MPSRSAPLGPRRGLSLKELTAKPIINLRSVTLSEAAPVRLEQIEPSPHNARGAIERTTAFAELKASIKAHGLLQPLVVRRVGIRRILIAGHRRHAALRELAIEEPGEPRWQTVLVIERDVDAATAEALGLIENLQRTDLEPLEEAQALVRLREAYGLSLAQIAEHIGKSKMYVSNRVRLFGDTVLRDAASERTLPVSTLEVLLRAPEARRAEFVERARTERWTADQARTAVLTQPGRSSSSSAPARPDNGRHFQALIHQLHADLPRLEQLVGTLDPSERATLHALCQRVAVVTAEQP